MRDACLLAEEREIRNLIGSLWRSEEFIASHQDGWIARLVEDVARLPLVFYRMDRPDIEMAHNMAWMRFIALRDYKNPAINDLYYLRQLSYVARMSYSADATWNNWYRKMAECAFAADFDSEVTVYINFPRFRKKTFPFEIWVDRFNRGLPTLADIRVRRLDAIRHPDPFDFIEAQLHSFYRQNVLWAKIWQRNFRRVEQRMVDFVAEAARDRGSAIESLEAWLRNEVIVVSGMTVPFHIEAERFTDHWKENQHLYGNEILRL